MNRKRILAILGGMVIVAIVVAINSSGDSASAKAPASTSPDAGEREVSVVVVNRVPRVRKLRATTLLESRRDALLSAEVSGRVAERPTREGTRTRPGDVIIGLESRDFRVQRDLARVASEEASLKPDVPAVERATRRLELELAQDRLDKCRVSAPFEGTVEKLLVDLGEWVQPGVPVARLVDHDALRIVVGLVEEEAVRVRVGTPATFRVDAWRDDEFEARVVRVGGTADATHRKFDIELDIEKADKRLRVGMFAAVEIPIGGSEPMMLLPKNAVRRRFEQPLCFVAVEEGGRTIARERVVEIRDVVGDLGSYRLASGLNDGERAILGPLTGLEDGAPIRIRDAVRETDK